MLKERKMPSSSKWHQVLILEAQIKSYGFHQLNRKLVPNAEEIA